LEKENGTGLGLTVVQKIVEDHGGEVLVERSAESRTIFRITFLHTLRKIVRMWVPWR